MHYRCKGCGKAISINQVGRRRRLCEGCQRGENALSATITPQTEFDEEVPRKPLMLLSQIVAKTKNQAPPEIVGVPGKGSPLRSGPLAPQTFWSIFKRGVVGTFHKVTRKYMPLYVAEFQFRYKQQENEDIFGTAIARC